ncbi:MrpH family fimbial adhesin [Serratia sp. IR-2025]|uniref:MrpH family fimbial adhesin n=1 Tax=Serratia marcescens TaxID=615 RepID=UPI0038799AEA
MIFYSESIRSAKNGNILYGWVDQRDLTSGVNANSVPHSQLVGLEIFSSWKYVCVNFRTSPTAVIDPMENYTTTLFDVSKIERPATCEFLTNNVTIDHGVLSSKDINGSRASSDVFISCSGKASVNVKTLDSGISLNSEGNLYSNITINGVNGMTGTTLALDAAGGRVKLESTLVSAGSVKPGDFFGNVILSMNVL